VQTILRTLHYYQHFEAQN